MICEFNESLTRHAIYDNSAIGKAAVSTCQSEATWQCGTTNQWHLCDEHAELPIFRRLKKRVRMEELRRAA